jgi:hypothetical protein
MGQNFVGADRDQVFLLPPSLRDWLPEDHLVKAGRKLGRFCRLKARPLEG